MCDVQASTREVFYDATLQFILLCKRYAKDPDVQRI